MIKKQFNDTQELWVWLFENSKMMNNSKISDCRYSQEIDKQMDSICKKLKDNKTVTRHGFQIFVDYIL